MAARESEKGRSATTSPPVRLGLSHKTKQAILVKTKVRFELNQKHSKGWDFTTSCWRVEKMVFRQTRPVDGQAPANQRAGIRSAAWLLPGSWDAWDRSLLCLCSRDLMLLIFVSVFFVA